MKKETSPDGRCLLRIGDPTGGWTDKQTEHTRYDERELPSLVTQTPMCVIQHATVWLLRSLDGARGKTENIETNGTYSVALSVPAALAASA